MTSQKEWNRDLIVAGVVVSVGFAGFFIYRFAGSGGDEIKVYRSIQDSTAVRAQSQAAPVAGPAAAIAPDDFAAHGDHLFESRRYDEAIDFYKQALKKNPKDADTLNDLGLALFYTGKDQEAIESFKKATAVDPKMQRAWLSMGFFLSSMKRYDESNKALLKAIYLAPASAQGIEAKKILEKNQKAVAAP